MGGGRERGEAHYCGLRFAVLQSWICGTANLNLRYCKSIFAVLQIIDLRYCKCDICGTANWEFMCGAWNIYIVCVCFMATKVGASLGVAFVQNIGCMVLNSAKSIIFAGETDH
jgi:hypothetical protein